MTLREKITKILMKGVPPFENVVVGTAKASVLLEVDVILAAVREALPEKKTPFIRPEPSFADMSIRVWNAAIDEMLKSLE